MNRYKLSKVMNELTHRQSIYIEQTKVQNMYVGILQKK